MKTRFGSTGRPLLHLEHPLIWVMTFVLLSQASVSSSSPRKIRILPLGDSITFGCGDSCGYPAGQNCVNNSTLDCPSPFNSSCHGGYRTYLWRSLRDAGYTSSIEFVGPFTNGPSDIDRHHAGYPGAAIGPSSSDWDLLYYLDEWSSFEPDVILLMIGTNDVWASTPESELQEHLYGLLLKTFERLPRAHVLISNLLAMPSVWAQYPTTLTAWTLYNSQVIPSIVHNLTTPLLHLSSPSDPPHQYQLTLVDAVGEIGLCPNEPNDLCCAAFDVHPSDYGYARLASVWYNALTPLLPLF
eukprot:TRINITY_DN1296_c0_g1_i1.p1 TRINITY_DN1296_c0_g1~~TRINITY_DN1296_c0_g1_i1.p1  ORF type:complete len:314 (-),score=50.56 TRINITY_DN1296_c0_g1_i1:170-1063(-)